MRIFMTFQTVGGKLREDLHRPGQLSRSYLLNWFEMTRSAGLFLMGSFKDVTCPGMIKCYFVPTIHAVAAYTARFRIIFLLQNRFVDILMAIPTVYSYLPETPPIILLVTGKAGGCQVSPAQLKGTLVMHFDGEIGSFKSLDGMTFRTIGCPLWCYKLLFMVVRVAVGTALIS